MTTVPTPSPRDGRSDATVYAVGDVHGCYDLLVDLLERIVADAGRSGPGDATLVFVGDYIDRGPATSDVLSALIWLERHAPFATVFLRGNHEQALLDYLADPVPHKQWLRVGGRATLQSYGIDVAEGPLSDAEHHSLRDRLADRLPASHLDFLRRLRLFHETDHFVFVHAGLRPDIPLAEQSPDDLLWIREGFLEERTPGPKRIVHGHTWVDDAPQLLAHRIGIDTGAFKTGVLTAARIRGKDVRFINTAGQGG